MPSIKRRDTIATMVNKPVELDAVFGGIFLPKGKFIDRRTILLKTVTKDGTPVDDHMWINTGNHMMFESFKEGDPIKIYGTVIKYKKHNPKRKKMTSDFSIEVEKCWKIE